MEMIPDISIISAMKYERKARMIRTKVSWTEFRVKNRQCFVIKPVKSPTPTPISADTVAR